MNWGPSRSFNDIGNLARSCSDRSGPYPTATRIGEPEQCCAAKKKCCSYEKVLPASKSVVLYLMCRMNVI
jgi:hypothetical protein